MTLKNIITGKAVAVRATANHPQSSHGKAVWVDSHSNALCQVGLEQLAGYELVDDRADLTEEQRRRKELGDRIVELRREHYMTQSDLAGKIGVFPNHIPRIEGGRYSIGYDVLYRIADAFDCDITFTPRGR